eukprot:52361-Lingulodinium_polyedra.AAC.1
MASPASMRHVEGNVRLKSPRMEHREVAHLAFANRGPVGRGGGVQPGPVSGHMALSSSADCTSRTSSPGK